MAVINSWMRLGQRQKNRMWFCLEQQITIIDLEFETMFELLENSCIDHDLDMSIATD